MTITAESEEPSHAAGDQQGRCPDCGWTAPGYITANLVAYAVADHRHYACLAMTGPAATVAIGWSWRRSLTDPVGALAATALVIVADALPAGVLAAAVTVALVARSGYRAMQRRKTRRQDLEEIR